MYVQNVLEYIEIEAAKTTILVIDHQSEFSGRIGRKTRAIGYFVPGTGCIFIAAVIPGIGTAAFHQLLPDHALGICNVK